MKLADFTPANGETDNSKIWQSGAQSNLIAHMLYGGEDYQVKIHAAKPKWFNTDQKISKLQNELSSCDASDIVTRDKINSELESLRRAKDKYDKKDRVSDAFLTYKQKLISVVNSIGDDCIVPPADYWKEPISFKGDETYSIDATRWVKSDVGHSDKPLLFKDLSERQQYDIIASLAEELDKLHKKGIVHSDLKIGNTLIVRQGGNFKAVLIDFDCAIVLDELYRQAVPYGAWLNILGGTYFSPELQELFNIADEGDQDQFEAFDFRRITDKADIFALGVTIYEYYYGEASGLNLLPMISDSGKPLTNSSYGLALACGYKLNLPDSVPDLLYSAISWMMDADPNARPTAQQVCELFRSANASVPAKYQRNPLWEEHREIYELTLPDGYTIRHARRPNYQYNSGGSTWFTRSIKDLEAEKLVKRKGEPPIDESHKLWPSDGEGALPLCAKRASVEGKYAVKVDGFDRVVNFAELKEMGVLCTEAELATLWPRDNNLRVVTSNKLVRDMAKGVGYYRYDKFMTLVTSKELVTRGLAVDKSVKSSLRINFRTADAELYEVNPDADTSNVVSVVRDVFSGTRYIFNFSDKRSESLTLEQMLNKGYIKRK